MKRIAVITATRAEYSLLRPVYLELKKIKNIRVDLIVTGTHLSKDNGRTINEIKEDRIRIYKKISIIKHRHENVSNIFSNALLAFDKLFKKEKYNMIVLLGDRYETLAFATDAMFNNIPIAHLYGGETTQGAIDEAIRHSISKMSYLHFTSCDEYKNRVIQLGEDPRRVFNVGSVGIENVVKTKLLSKAELSRKLKIDLDKYFVVTYHPVTLNSGDQNVKDFQNVLKALEKYDEYQVVFTKSNADEGGYVINKMIDKFCAKHDNAHSFFSLGSTNYFSLVKYAKCVVGNSSSGLTEVPALLVPTVNIGDRQGGRIMSNSIYSCKPICSDIIKCIEKSMKLKKAYKLKDLLLYKKDTSKNIARVIRKFLFNENINLKKKFFDIKGWSK